MNNRTILTGFAILVLGGIVALIVALGSSGEKDGSEGKVAQGTTTGDGEPRRSSGSPAPSLPSTGGDGDTAGDGDSTPEPPTIYMTDGGVLVRDHRKDRTKPAPLGDLPAPRNKPQKMSHGAVIAVRGALRKVVRDCERGLSEDDTGDKPRVQAVVTVTVVSEELTVDEVDVHATDIAESERMRTCVRDGFAGAKVAVPGQEDIASFKQTHPFRLGR